MKLLLVVPRYRLTNKKNYHYTFPLGLGYISSVLKKNNYDLDILNLNHFNGKTKDILFDKLSDSRYDIVMTGHIGIGYAITEIIIKTTKSHPTSPKTIIGGGLLTSEAQLIFNELKPDYGVMGEGEVTIIELLKAIENNEPLEDVLGICFWKDNKAVFTKSRPVIQDINTIPLPDYDGFGFKEKLDNEASNFNLCNIFDYPRTYPLFASRGCPYQCTFCYHTLGIKYRERSLDSIFEELKKAVPKYKINIVEIIDDMFSIKKERLLEFCKQMRALIKETPWELKWECQLSVNTVDREILQTLKDSGCYVICYGLESYSKKVLESIKKPITPEQIDRAIKLTMEVGLRIHGSFIFGDVAETKETAKETLDYWKKNCKGQIFIGFIQPYPGSEIYKKCVQKGIIKDKLNFIKNKIAHTNWINMTDNMSDSEILKLKKEILKARKKYNHYIVASKIKNISKNKYDVTVNCPYCKKKNEYKNVFTENPHRLCTYGACRSCKLRFYTVSFIYKLEMDYYGPLDFFRKNYLNIRDKVLKKRI